MGPHRADPRTGQILDADILYESENYRGLAWGYLRDHLAKPEAEEPFFLAKRRDPCDCELELLRLPEKEFAFTALLLVGAGRKVPEEYVAQAVKETVMHEVGHTLGLRHNFKASTAIPFDRLHDRAYAEQNGLLGSVMEYNPPNVSRDPAKQGYWYSPTLGAYDYWAIEYGYKPLPAEKEEEELRAIASRCDEPGHQFATDEDTYGPTNLDPAATVFDLSNDPLAWCRERLALCEDLWAKDWSVLREPGYGYRLHRLAMSSLLSAYRRALEISARWVGGTSMDRRHPGDEGLPFRNVPIERQREALKLLREKAFAPGLFRFSPERLATLAPNRFGHWGIDEEEDFAFPLREQVRAMRRSLLQRLLDPSLLRHMDEAEERALPNEPAMTAGELLRALTDTIWGDAGEGRPIEPGLRLLQSDHLEALARLVLQGEGAPETARNLARAHLLEIDVRCSKRQPVDEETDAHIAAVRARIAEIREARLVKPSR
jgi:hypothetical protein